MSDALYAAQRHLFGPAGQSDLRGNMPTLSDGPGRPTPREERGGRGRVGSANRWTPEPPASSADAPIGEQSRRRESGTRTTSPHFRARAEKLTKNMEVEMLIDEIRRTPAKVLTEEQRESYWANGYLLLERLIPEEWLERLRAATDEMVERSRVLTASDRVFDLEPDHTAADPRLRRVTSPVDQHPDYWAYARESVLADVAADLGGPDVAFHHSKLNFKWARGGAEVKWHQDIQYWPHTNYTPLTFGTYLYDCGMEQGPLGVLPGSHERPLYDLYADDGTWAGALSDRDAAELDTERTAYLPGPAGSVTIHNCRTAHHSAANDSPIGRPLLLNVYKAADALPYTANPLPSSHAEEVVRGNRARWAHHDPRPCLIPPDWSGGYTSLFALQQKEAAPGSM